MNQRSMIAKTAYSLSLLYGRMNMGKKLLNSQNSISTIKIIQMRWTGPIWFWVTLITKYLNMIPPQFT